MKHVKGRMDESILVCVYYGPNGERLIRRGYKMASMLDCPLYILTIDHKPFDAFDAEKSGYVEDWKQLADELDVEQFIMRDNEKRPVSKVIREVASDLDITQIIVGQSAQSRWEEITRGSFLNVLLKEVPFVDFHIVAVERPMDGESEYEMYERGVRAYLKEDEKDYQIAFTCPNKKAIEGIFFKEIGTDFDNGIFKFAMHQKMYDVDVVEGTVTEPEKIPNLHPVEQ